MERHMTCIAARPIEVQRFTFHQYADPANQTQGKIHHTLPSSSYAINGIEAPPMLKVYGELLQNDTGVLKRKQFTDLLTFFSMMHHFEVPSCMQDNGSHVICIAKAYVDLLVFDNCDSF